MLFLYRISIINRILNNLGELTFKIIFGIIYIYLFGITLILINQGTTELFKLYHPKHTFLFIFTYLKWIYYNYNDIKYFTIVKIIIAFLLPHYLFTFIRKIKWKYILMKALTCISSYFNFSFKENNNDTQSSEPTSTQSFNGKITPEEIQLIKKIIMRDVEIIVTKRLEELSQVRSQVLSEKKNLK